MATVDPAIFRQALGNLLTAVGFEVVSFKRGRRPFDFLFAGKDGHRIALRVDDDKPEQRALEEAADYLRFATTGVDCFLLTTPSSPGKMQKSKFARTLKAAPVQAVWIGADQVAMFLGLEDEAFDLTSPDALNALQTAAVTTNMEKYLDLTEDDKRQTKRIKSSGKVSTIVAAAQRRMSGLPPQYNTLRRQFAFSVIQRFNQKNAPLEEQLLIGQRIEDVSVVFTDLKNFSLMVTALGGTALRRSMSRYYRRARELVWDHGGVLDKFIGDAVLAIFNYPYFNTHAPMNALAFSRDLILLGEEIFGELREEYPDMPESGTRIGICTGDLWILDIGQDVIEVSFFGDTINLAARLEHNAATNAVLMDQHTRTAILAHDPGLIKIIDPAERRMPPSKVKGQNREVQAWEAHIDQMELVEIVPERKSA